MWGHFRARAALVRRAMGRPALAASFRIWKHTIYFHKLHTAARERGKALRKQRTQDLLQAASKAALDRDFREHHRIIQVLAPKAPPVIPDARDKCASSAAREVGIDGLAAADACARSSDCSTSTA